MEYPNVEFRQLVVETRDEELKKEIYTAREQRKIHWREYTLSKINDLELILTFIKESVDSTFIDEDFDKIGRPSTDSKVLAKAVLFCEAVGLPERQAQGWLKIMGQFMGIFENVDDRKIGRAYENPEVARILKEIFEKYKSSDGILQGDGTGLERSRKENYESTKNKNGNYMTSVVDSREIVQAFDITGRGEEEVMLELIEIVDGESLRLDAGFNCHELTTKIAELGMRPFIYPMKSNNVNGDIYWTAMYLTFYWDILNWLKEYHLRSHTESFHSSFKRTFGIVTKLKFCSKFSQVCARIIIHNFRRSVYFRMVD